MVDLKKEVSKNLKAFLKHQNIDVAEFAEKSNLTVERMQSILNEESLLELEELAAISQAYNVSSEYFLGLIKYPFPIAKSEEESKLYRKLSDLTETELLVLVEKLKERE